MIRHLRLSEDGKTLTADARPTTAGQSGFIVRWDVETGEQIDRTEAPWRAFDEIMGTAYSPDGRWSVQTRRS
jgi:hypothetical protein